MKNKKNIDGIMMGPEPVAPGPISDYNDMRILLAFNWYNYFNSAKDSRIWIFEYMKKQKYDKKKIDLYKNSPDNMCAISHCATARMLNNGWVLPQGHIDRLQKHIEECVAFVKTKKVSKTVAKRVPNIKANIENKIRDIISDIDEMLDTMYNSSYAVAEFHVYDLLKKYDAKPVMRDAIHKKYSELYEELTQVAKNSEVKEGYRHLLKKDLTFYQKGVKLIIDDIDRYFAVKKVTKLPRKQSVNKPPSTKDVKYLKQYNELKLSSVDPVKIIGSKTVFLYNVKTKKLTYMNSLEGGFSIKGTTINNFDEKMSTAKTISKPHELMQTILTGSPSKLKKIMPTIKTTDQKPSGRMNEDTLIVRVVK